jgi:hypothetical protein
LIGDDVTVVAPTLSGGGAVLWSGFALAMALGVTWALLTYGAGAVVARHFGQPPVERLPRARSRQATGTRRARETL